MNVEYCILDTRVNRYFFFCCEDMVDSYLSVHHSNCKEDGKSPWLFKKSRKVGDWK